MAQYLSAAIDRMKFMIAQQQSYTIDKTGILSDRRSVFPSGGGLEKLDKVYRAVVKDSEMD